MSNDETVEVMMVDPNTNPDDINKRESTAVMVLENLNEEIIEELAKQAVAENEQIAQQHQHHQVATALDIHGQAIEHVIQTATVNNHQDGSSCVDDDDATAHHSHQQQKAGEEVIEEERHIEITIGDPVADKVEDSCVGTDNRRYYKVKWKATWEPEEELLVKYQNLIEDYWKVTVEEQNNLEHKNLINNLLENISQHHEASDEGVEDVKPVIKGNKAQNIDNGLTNQENPEDDSGNVVETLTVYKQVNSPEHKISDEPTVLLATDNRPPPLVTSLKEELAHKCEQCWRSYASERKLRDHKRKMHTNLGVYQCSECPKQFTTKRSLQMHMNRHTGLGPHQCPGCSKRYMTPHELAFHKKSCSQLVEKEFLCQECGKRFQTKTHLQFHTKIHLPPEEKPFKCQFCTRTFAYNHDCVHHMRLHIGEKPYKCDKCDKAFHRKSYLTEHMFIHTGVSRYQCETCQTYFKTQQMLQTHVKNIHILKRGDRARRQPALKKDKPKTSKSSKANNKNKYRCEECDKDFKFVKEFHYHCAVNHKDKLPNKNKKSALDPSAQDNNAPDETKHKGGGDEEVLADFEPTMVYKCRHCDKTFRWHSVLKKHAETHKVATTDKVKPTAHEHEHHEELESEEDARENSPATINEEGETEERNLAQEIEVRMDIDNENDILQSSVETDSGSCHNDENGLQQHNYHQVNTLDAENNLTSNEQILTAAKDGPTHLETATVDLEESTIGTTEATSSTEVSLSETAGGGMVCYVTDKGVWETVGEQAIHGDHRDNISDENVVEELNILACGHCLVGFTDENELNRHVITEHSDLIDMSGVIEAGEHLQQHQEQHQSLEQEQQQHVIVDMSEQQQQQQQQQQHVLIDGTEGIKIIQLAMEAKQELENLEKQKLLELEQQQQQQQDDNVEMED